MRESLNRKPQRASAGEGESLTVSLNVPSPMDREIGSKARPSHEHNALDPGGFLHLCLVPVFAALARLNAAEGEKEARTPGTLPRRYRGKPQGLELPSQ